MKHRPTTADTQNTKSSPLCVRLPRFAAPALRTQYLYHTMGQANTHRVTAGSSVEPRPDIAQGNINALQHNQQTGTYQHTQSLIAFIHAKLTADIAIYPLEERYFILCTTLEQGIDLALTAPLLQPRSYTMADATANAQDRRKDAKTRHRAIYFCTTDHAGCIRELSEQINPYQTTGQHADAVLFSGEQINAIFEYYCTHNTEQSTTAPAERQNFYHHTMAEKNTIFISPVDPISDIKDYWPTSSTTTNNKSGWWDVIFSLIGLALVITTFILLN